MDSQERVVKGRKDRVAMKGTRRAARGAIAGSGALAAKDAAEALFFAGGRKLLSETGQQLVRESATRLAEIGEASGAAELALPLAGVGEIAAAGGQVANLASRAVILSSIRTIAGATGRAAGVGVLVDGGIAAVEAGMDYARGHQSAGEAVRHVAVEAGTGGVAAAAGVGLAAGVVVLTGPLSPLALAALAGGTCIVAKIGLRRWFGSYGEVSTCLGEDWDGGLPGWRSRSWCAGTLVNGWLIRSAAQWIGWYRAQRASSWRLKVRISRRKPRRARCELFTSDPSEELCNDQEHP